MDQQQSHLEGSRLYPQISGSCSHHRQRLLRQNLEVRCTDACMTCVTSRGPLRSTELLPSHLVGGKWVQRGDWLTPWLDANRNRQYAGGFFP